LIAVKCGKGQGLRAAIACGSKPFVHLPFLSDLTPLARRRE
jgi:hypothetical protein